MRIGLIGLSYERVPLALREKIAKVCQKELYRWHLVEERDTFVLLSTCNRVEIYFSSDYMERASSTLLDLLHRNLTCEERASMPLSSLSGPDVFLHLAKVTMGMESAIIAETEIQGQVKKAYLHACKQMRLSQDLHFMFQKCLHIGKKVRSKLGHVRFIPTLEKIIFEECQRKFTHQDLSVLFIGASSINRQIIRYFKHRGLENITIMSQDLHRAKAFSLNLQTHALDWSSLSHWHEYDIVIVGTKYHFYLIDENTTLPQDETLLIDLSVPRNIHPSLHAKQGIQLINIDELNEKIQKFRHLKTEELDLLQEAVSRNARRQMLIYKNKILPRFETPKLHCVL